MLVALSAVSAAVLAPSAAQAAGPDHTYTFTTLDNANDPTFNQLLGINSSNVIAGYFGIGSHKHPNKGYTLSPPYGQANYTNENFPGSTQTQVTAINNDGATAGFWVNANKTNTGFVDSNGVFTSYTDPLTPTGAGSVNQLLGLNDDGTAVGFYTGANGKSRAYTLNLATDTFTTIKHQGKNALATGINDAGDVVGFESSSTNVVSSFFIQSGISTRLQFPGGSSTEALGINSSDQIVGSYVDGSGVMHGFVLDHPTGPGTTWHSIDDPNGIGSTVVNGINNAGDLVGFYTDAAGNTDGMLATP